jgi:hypothetical protein
LVYASFDGQAWVAPESRADRIDADLDYVTVHKMRLGAQVKSNSKVIHGRETQIPALLEKSPSQTTNSAYIERSNLNWRLWDCHFARKAPTVDGSIRWLKAKLPSAWHASTI